jgi:CheY-like chemotaxis protein
VLEFREVDLATVIGDITPMLRRLISEQIELIVRPGPDPAPVMADVGQLEQVLMNLVINARDAMPAGGRLTIETAGVDLDAAFAAKHPGAQIGPHAMLAVGDTGEGIKPDILDKIFDPFFTTKEVGKGTGLGLSTVHGIVQQHHGCIGVESEVGRGTTFRVYLPGLDRAAQSPRREAPPETATRGAETILLAEDELEVRRVAREVLELSGYTVLEAHGADDALRIVDQRAAPIDLLLSDVIMPRLNGPELADQVRCKYPHMRVLYMSGYADNSVTRVLASDALFLQKPFTPAGLARKVREALDLTPP